MATRALWSAATATVLMPWTAVADIGEADFSPETTQNLYEIYSAPSDHTDCAPAIYSCRSFPRGALMGAAAGGLIGSLRGNRGAGALIGAGTGAIGGYLVEQHKKGHID